MKTVFAAILTMIAFFYSSFASAEIYKWVDAKGETHFSDKPHQSAPVKVAKIVQSKPQPLKRKSHKKALRKVAIKSTKLRKVVESLSKQVSRTAKITQGKRARQTLREAPRDIPEKKPEPQRRVARKIMPVVAKLVVIEQAPETETQAKPITNFKQSLCRDNRRYLAVLQEKGFDYYADVDGELRVVWGVEGFYRQKKRYLSAAEVATKIKEISFEIERYCDDSLDKTQQAKARQDWIRSEYCDVSKLILADLKHPFMRTSESEIKEQENEVERYCFDYPANKYRDDERYYPMSLKVERLQQKHFLYR